MIQNQLSAGHTQGPWALLHPGHTLNFSFRSLFATWIPIYFLMDSKQVILLLGPTAFTSFDGQGSEPGAQH